MIRDDKREVELKVGRKPKFEFDIITKCYIRCQENSLRCRWLIRVDKRLVGLKVERKLNFEFDITAKSYLSREQFEMQMADQS